MSILNVDKIQPIGGGSTITVDATDIQASTGTITANSYTGVDNTLKVSIGGTEYVRTHSTGQVSIGSTFMWRTDTVAQVYGKSPDLSLSRFNDQFMIAGNETSGAINTGAGIQLFGHDGVSERGMAYIRGLKENGTSGDRASYLAFATRINGGTLEERLRIDSSGNLIMPAGAFDLRVGDNTNSNAGTQTISVGSISSGSSGGIGIFANPTNGNSFVQFGDGTSSADQYRGYMNYRHADDSLRFGTAGSDRLHITSNGRFGIGTNSPSKTLHIHGDSGSELPVYWIRGGSSIGGYLYSDGGGSGIVGGDGVLANTGIYLVTDTRIDFRVNGAERIRINASGHIKVPDNAQLQFGGALDTGNGDLQIYHDSTANFNNIQSLTGSNLRIRQQSNGAGLYLAATNIYLQNHNNNETYLHAQNNGSVSLYHDNEEKLSTQANGVKVQDTTATGAYLTMATSSGIAGKLYATGNNTLGFLDSQNHYMLKGVKDGALELYHDNVKVVKTNSYGMQVGAKATGDSNSHTTTDGWVLADSWTKAVFTSNTAGNSPFTIYNAGSSYNRYMCYFKFDGGFANYSSNDINLCDERVKKDFAEVPSQWNNIKNIGFKHFRYKEDSSSEPLKIGVVAQQVESVYPDLIDKSWPQGDANPNTGEGTFYKGVKEEQLLMYSVKALQEAQARIETLEAEVATLKGS